MEEKNGEMLRIKEENDKNLDDQNGTKPNQSFIEIPPPPYTECIKRNDNESENYFFPAPRPETTRTQFLEFDHFDFT